MYIFIYLFIYFIYLYVHICRAGFKKQNVIRYRSLPKNGESLFKLIRTLFALLFHIFKSSLKKWSGPKKDPLANPLF